MPDPVLGVLTVYKNDQKFIEWEERQFFQKLTAAGCHLGLEVVVLTPEDVDYRKAEVHAQTFQPSKSKWIRKWIPLPPLIYDRFRYHAGGRVLQLRQFRQSFPDLIYLSRPLADKWTVYKKLYQNAEIRPHLPLTTTYTSKEDLFRTLKSSRVVYLKPIRGTGGRGIYKIEKFDRNRYILSERDLQHRIVKPVKLTEGQIVSRLEKINISSNFVIQQGIDIHLNDKRVHDFRLLMQKNGEGKWEVTGCAGRIGPKGSITSNLHGGGKAVALQELLNRRFNDNAQVSSLRHQMVRFSHQVVRDLEREFGRLCELALDLAIDREGKLWLFEVNSKPSREVFSRIGDRDTYWKAVRRPLEYALHLYEQESRLNNRMA
ncbi:YheC/YheD family endospore coat-associated protein [Ferviditalea candida]|uniref:YheC/YheD family protein n=1 Tax=Ferviditalea candida TaxID=3108399 RepID=A0ABU5ZE64_9BACL|nr:YheC/YheD family protein [Paenibacillaceae bacterium T2]